MRRANASFSFTFLFFISLSLSAQQADTLTNEKVIKLHKAGFSKETLKSKILNTSAKFDVSIDAMVELKKAGLPEDVISAMIDNPTGANTLKNSDPNNNGELKAIAGINLSSGIYFKEPSGNYQEIEPSVFTSSKTKGSAQILISGLINAKVKASLSGNQSSFIIPEKSPTFVFVFDTISKGGLNNDNNQWMTSARSPKEFLLVELKVEKKSREITIGKGNAVKSDFGIDDKFVVMFSIKKIGNSIYEVVPQTPLPEGEYCFMFAQGVRQGESSKVFDFSIQLKKDF